MGTNGEIGTTAKTGLQGLCAWLDRKEPACHVAEGRGWRDGRKGGGRKKCGRGKEQERSGKEKKRERGKEGNEKKGVTLSVEKIRCDKI